MENYPAFRQAMFHFEVRLYLLLTRLPLNSCITREIYYLLIIIYYSVAIYYFLFIN